MSRRGSRQKAKRTYGYQDTRKSTGQRGYRRDYGREMFDPERGPVITYERPPYVSGRPRPRIVRPVALAKTHQDRPRYRKSPLTLLSVRTPSLRDIVCRQRKERREALFKTGNAGTGKRHGKKFLNMAKAKLRC